MRGLPHCPGGVLVTPERWQQVEELFAAALHQAPEERATFLDQTCAEDGELRREVLNLLAVEPRMDGFLDRPVLPPPLHRRQLSAGGHVGPYRVLRCLGSGGMGVIYLAERDDGQFRQEVAVKVLRADMESAELARRLRHERQVLARLEHPYIARLLDGGTTDDDLPYLAMEYVEGEPIDAYCRHQRLALRPRLELFVKVCDGVQFLHQNLILHRDLKPANILVGSHGEPKLVDFGIAKLLQPEILALPATTTVGLSPLTMDFASPEQVRGEVLTTASDVYSLGMLLYQLLAGGGPYPSTRSLPEKVKHICHQEPLPPSRFVRQDILGDHAGAISRQLAGDLDAIVLKALAKEPWDRYASAELLGEDLRRHLAGRPVLARRSTAIYRASKFLRRSWRGASTAAALLALAAVFTLQLKQAGDQAVLERDRAEEVSQFLVALFAVPDPDLVTGAEVSARQLLDAGTAKIRDQLRDQPEVRARLLATMGRSYLGLGLHQEAEPPLKESVALWRQLGGPVQEWALAVRHLAHLRLRQARYDEAEALFREAISLLGQTRDEQALAGALYYLAVLLEERGELDLSEQLFRRTLAIRQKHQAEQPEQVANVWYRLANLLVTRGRYEQGEVYARRALELFHQAETPADPKVAVRSSDVLAEALAGQGQLQRSEELLEATLAARQELFGPDHQMVAFSIHGLGHLRRSQGRFAEAEELYRRALEMLRLRLGPQHTYVGIAQRNLAAAQLAQGRTAEALDQARQAVAILSAALPADHWRVADAESLLGDCLLQSGDVEQAAPLLRRSYQTLEARLGHRSQATSEARDRLRRLGAASFRVYGVP